MSDTRHVHITRSAGEPALCGFNLATADKPLWCYPGSVKAWEADPDQPEGYELCQPCCEALGRLDQGQAT